MRLVFGFGDIARRGIIPAIGGDGTTVDVTDFHAVDESIRMNEPDVVVNCAGVSHPAPLAGPIAGAWREEIEVNLIGSYNIARASVAHNVRTMIFIASVAGMHGKPHHSGYSASKAGVISLVQSLGHEGYNAYAISPGRVDTKMREHDYPGEDPRTRLTCEQVGAVASAILAGKYERGDNIIVRKIGFETHLKVDRGEPWRSWLRVGEAPIV